MSDTCGRDDRARRAVDGSGMARAIDGGRRRGVGDMAGAAAGRALPATRLAAVRIGLGIYGLSPFDGRASATRVVWPVETGPPMPTSADAS